MFSRVMQQPAGHLCPHKPKSVQQPALEQENKTGSNIHEEVNQLHAPVTLGHGQFINEVVTADLQRCAAHPSHQVWC